MPNEAEELKNLETMVGAQLANELPTTDLIRELIDKVRSIFPSVSDESAEALARKFEARHGVTMNIGSVLTGEDDYEPWLDHAKSEIESYYWERYRKFLVAQNLSGQVITSLDDVTDRILGLLENPRKEGCWDRRGMVVGHVQSGKTSNYTGLICKAADSGYKVIIVVAGIHNNLRNQTQTRIDEGFIGFDSSRIQEASIGEWNTNVIGAGRFDSGRRPVWFTTSKRDFNTATATSVGTPLENLNQPAVFVIKKNTSTLKNLINWLKGHNTQLNTASVTEPLLLIDDEADNASINTKRRTDEISKINGQIRELLRLFDRSCYVGYTATPFANIFVDPDSEDEMLGEDLFPHNFIISLDPPSNYFGASRVFLDEDGDCVRYIEDNEDVLPLSHRKDHQLTVIPNSLATSVRTFVVARAIRLARDDTDQHNSMLVNTSRFVDVQQQLHNKIHELLYQIRSSVRVNGALSESESHSDKEIAALHDVFIEEYAEICEVPWPTVRSCLLESVSPITVVQVNSRSSRPLDYGSHGRHGLNVIAVGGLSLSRGLTLEGLIISYFLRNSIMYDTLMQMGRWFGYRPEYEDLCRVWMPREAEGWYCHISESIEELREELRMMEAANATPNDFGLKVRSHPDTLVVTARNKMGTGRDHRVSIGLANQFIETARLHSNKSIQEENLNAAIILAERMISIGKAPKDGEKITGGRLVRRVPVSFVIDFLKMFKNHKKSIQTETGPVRKYIEDRSLDELKHWDVCFPGIGEKQKSRDNDPLISNHLGFELVCQRRGAGTKKTADTLDITNKQRVASRGVEKVGLSDEQINQAETVYKERDRSGKSVKNYPDHIYRQQRTYPLLIVHLLAIETDSQALDLREPVMAWSMSFPKTNREEEKTEYVVNSRWFEENYSFSGAEDEGDEYY